MINELIYASFARLKDDISRELMQFEVSTLYQGKLYDSEAKMVQAKFSRLALFVDNMLNEQMELCAEKIEEGLEKEVLPIKDTRYD